MFRSWPKWLLVVVAAVGLGYVLNVSRDESPKGFVSPTVFARESGQKSKSDFSPFGLLFNRSLKPGLISPSSSSSLVNPSPKQVGNVLGQSVSSRDGSTSNSQTSGSNPSSSTTSSPTSNSTTSSSSNSAPTITSGETGSLSTAEQAVQDVTAVVLDDLKTGNYTALYNLMSVDFKNTFSLEDFVASFPPVLVSSGSLAGDPKIFGSDNEWAEQSVKLVLSDATSQNYLNIYHLENTAWTLYATQDQ